MKKYQVLKWTAEVREKELQHLEEVELADKFFECATNRVFKIIPKT